MQAPEPVRRSPWALRVAAAGGVMLLLGGILMLSQSSSVTTAMDPREQHHGVYQGEGTFVTGELSDTCYRFYQVAGEPEMKVDLYMVEGSSLQADPIGEKNCLMDWQAMTADGTQMTVQKSWVLNASAEYALVTTCEEGCANTTGWLMSVNALQEQLFEAPWLIFGFSICCLGVFTLPVALIVYLASKPSKAPKVMMVSADGQLIPITDVNPEHPTMFIKDEVAEQQTSVAPPFSDTAEQQATEAFVDGLEDVQAGTLLTTEQVYALMRGDVETAQEQAKTGRYQTTTAEDAVEQAANAAAITSWDEGVPLAEPKPSSASPAKPATNRPSSSAPPTNQNAWKDWDEQ